ncbi:MAG: hypothetical protein AAAB35_05355 [Phyllobacterium sp.]|uniref:hypothetical protein n=1 Tax=Phyllobacterium sp. TaxID=1871046 RepID=UPI0030F1E65D
MDTPINLPTRVWQDRANDCKALVERLKMAGGNASIVLLAADLGIKGNSHMMMMDKNNLEIADLFLKWIDQQVKN